MRVSLQDVADHLRLNRSSVSRGLRGDPRIPLATRERIHEACTKLGYHPNPLISELATSRWDSSKISSGSTIAYIARSARDGTIGPAFSEFVSSMREQAATFGYQLEVFFRSDFPSSLKIQSTLRNRGITDVILGPIFEEKFIVELDWSKFNCIQFHPGFLSLPLHGVIKDHFQSIVLAWQKAVEYGYQRIGITLLDHPPRLMDDVLRVSAVQACQYQLFPHLPDIPPFHYRISSTNGKAFTKWIERHDPDIVIGFNDLHFHFLPRDRGIAYVCLHINNPSIGLSGILDTQAVYGIELIKLIHFSRRTHQWGIPEQRINHVIEPIWFDGFSMPNKKGIKVTSGLL